MQTTAKSRLSPCQRPLRLRMANYIAYPHFILKHINILGPYVTGSAATRPGDNGHREEVLDVSFPSLEVCLVIVIVFNKGAKVPTMSVEFDRLRVVASWASLKTIYFVKL